MTPDPEALHDALDALNRHRLCPTVDGPALDLATETTTRRREEAFVDGERALVHARAQAAPRTPDAFVAWFEALAEDGPGQHDPLFPWLAEEADATGMRWFLHQEVAGEAGFDDLVALTQIRMPCVAKLELARNYWDEMGRGKASGMHGPMLGRLAAALELDDDPTPIVWPSRALGNLLVALAANRRWAFQSIGALGVVELTAPWRAAHVDRGLARLGVSGRVRMYFALHATVDVKHSEAWNREILAPLVEEDPRRAPAIAEGALMRLTAGARCYEAYRRALASGRTRERSSA